jgi:hypothetical protein
MITGEGCSNLLFLHIFGGARGIIKAMNLTVRKLLFALGPFPE